MIFPSILHTLKRVNPHVILLVVLIASIGFALLYSAANGSFYPWAAKQMIRFGVGMAVMFAIASVDIRTWLALAYPLYAISLLLLLGVELMGFVGMGAQRWLDLYFIQLQPSEVMKIALILALARYFQSCTLQEIHKVRFLLLPLALILMPTLLALRQPDLGTAMILILTGVTLFFVTGVRLWKFLATGAAICVAIPFLWSRLYDYQQKRVLNFLYPESDPTNSGYHITQSKIALGSGGFTGKGFMQGTQSHLNFLPEKQTDFIFTMFSEEFGFVGGIFLLSLYALLIAYGFFVAHRSRNHFGRLVAIGLTTTIFLYVFINTAMVMGMLPVVGIPLPLISYGGTAMLTLLMGIGLIFSVSIYHDVRIGR